MAVLGDQRHAAPAIVGLEIGVQRGKQIGARGRHVRLGRGRGGNAQGRHVDPAMTAEQGDEIGAVGDHPVAQGLARSRDHAVPVERFRRVREKDEIHTPAIVPDRRRLRFRAVDPAGLGLEVRRGGADGVPA